jgi:hypothetical protein
MKLDINKIVFSEIKTTKKRVKINFDNNNDNNDNNDNNFNNNSDENKESKTANFKQIYHDGKVLQFWTPKMLMPFGIDNEYGKYLLKLEFDNETNEEHSHFKKVILYIEKLIKKKLEIEDNGIEWKSIIKKRENKTDIIELRIKNIRNNIQTEIINNNSENNNSGKNNYLKTIFDLEKQTYMKALIEINGLWDYRNNNIEKNKVGLICYCAKLCIC